MPETYREGTETKKRQDRQVLWAKQMGKRKRNILKTGNSKVRKTCKLPIAKLGRKLWVLCKEIIRKKYGNECYVCGRKNLEGSNWHTAHLIPKGACGASLRYDLRNLRPSCYHCNINLGGNGAEFLRKMTDREGQDYVDQIFRDRNLIVNAYDHYTTLLEKYKELMSSLS